MKVALTRPNYHSHLITPPLGIGYLASFLKSKGIQTKIIDGLNLSLKNEEIIKHATGFDLIGVSVLSDYYLQAKELTRKLKEAGKIVVWGGTHATALPEQVLEETEADFVVVGEGEITLYELVKALGNIIPLNPSFVKWGSVPNIPGLYSRRTQEFIPREFIKNLDDLPYPDWHQMDPRTYQKAPHGAIVKNFPISPLTSTRGCPYECTFCASPKIWRRIIRYRSPQNVVDEIEYLVKDFQVKEIHFEDDNLTLKRKHVVKICEEIINRNLKITWATPNGIRADQVDEDLLKLMKRSGCYSVSFGIESGNQYILDNVKKHETLAQMEQAIKVAHQVGLTTTGFFIFGLPGETKESVNKTIKFATNIPLDRAQFLLLDLNPGSELWDKHHTEIDYNYNKNRQNTTWVPPTISQSDLLSTLSLAFRKFIFRPRTLWSLIKHLKLSQLGFILRRLKYFRVLKISKISNRD